jgi:alginate O-acetyltransferase complex protein AlgI
LVDVYKDRTLTQRNALDLGLFITFFPQLIAGPIVRYHDINAQIARRTHSIDLFAEGVERFAVGLAKKALLANTFARVADGILALPPDAMPTSYAWLAIIAYTLQIYYDFSGYSDMAIGLGKLFGFRFLENFNYPYSALSLTDFWRRWHISLSRWFKDYVYIPLGGNRRGTARTFVNLYLVFFATGLWHGAALNFVLWGLGHGTLLVLERLCGKKIAAMFPCRWIKTALSHVYVALCVTLLWVFFRLDIHESIVFIGTLFHANSATVTPAVRLLVDTRFYIFLAVGVLASFPWWHKIRLPPASATVSQCAALIRYACALICLVVSLCALAADAYNPFIYFRF